MILQNISDAEVRRFYLRACTREGWSRDVLGLMIKSRVHERAEPGVVRCRGARIDQADGVHAQAAQQAPRIGACGALRPFQHFHLGKV